MGNSTFQPGRSESKHRPAPSDLPGPNESGLRSARRAL